MLLRKLHHHLGRHKVNAENDHNSYESLVKSMDFCDEMFLSQRDQWGSNEWCFRLMLQSYPTTTVIKLLLEMTTTHMKVLSSARKGRRGDKLGSNEWCFGFVLQRKGQA